MRALCLTARGQPDNVAVVELPRPELRDASEVRIAMHAAALNHLDVFVAQGAPGVPEPALPHIVGTDGAGVVTEVGPAVTHVRAGDRVVINAGVSCGHCASCLAGEPMYCRGFAILGEHRPGLAAEEVVLPGGNVLPIEGEWTWPEAGGFTLSMMTAWRMLHTRARLERGECVLVWGIGGGAALAALAIARHIGARVAVTSSSAAKLERALALGAEFAVNHAEVEDVPRLVKDHFGGGVDVVVDSVGAPTWQRSLRAMRPGGRLVTCGATAGPMVELDIRRLFWFQWSLLGSTMGTPREFADVVALGNAGTLRPVVDSVVPIARGAEAFRRMAHGDQFGKLVIEVKP